MSKHYSYERLLQSLYNTIVEPAAMPEFLELACEATDSHVASLLFHDFRTGTAGAEFLGVPTDLAIAYNERYAEDNVLLYRAAEVLKTGSICTSGGLVPLDELKSTRYWHEFLSLIDVEHCLGLCAIADANDLVVMSLDRGHSRPAHDEHDRDLMRRISPHWVNAFHIRQQLGTLHDTVTALEAALNRVTLAVLFLDGDGQVTRVNLGAERLLARGDIVALHRGRLVARYQPDARQLHLAIAAAIRVTTSLEATPVTPNRMSAPLLLHDTRGIPAAYVGVHPLAVRSLESAGGGRAQAVVFLRPLEAGNPCGLIDAVGELFGLTAAEARLAVSLHSTGDLAFAAQQVGITADAARTRLKTVFDKTGAHGQPALVRLLTELNCVVGAS